MLIGPVELFTAIGALLLAVAFTAIGALLLAVAFILHLRDHR